MEQYPLAVAKAPTWHISLCRVCSIYIIWMGHRLLFLAASHLHRSDVPCGSSTNAHLRALVIVYLH